MPDKQSQLLGAEGEVWSMDSNEKTSTCSFLCINSVQSRVSSKAGVYRLLSEWSILDSWTSMRTWLSWYRLQCISVPQPNVGKRLNSARLHFISVSHWNDDIIRSFVKFKQVKTHVYIHMYCTDVRISIRTSFLGTKRFVIYKKWNCCFNDLFMM